MKESTAHVFSYNTDLITTLGNGVTVTGKDLLALKSNIKTALLCDGVKVISIEESDNKVNTCALHFLVINYKFD